MKKFLLSVAVLAFLATPAFAEDGEGHGPKMDTDGDGLISKSEFMDMQEKRFSEIDANNDGKIQREEFKAMREKKRAEHKENAGKRKERREQKNEDAGE